MDKILKLFLEAAVEEDVELDERLTKSERLKKQVKNFGVELEWASRLDYEEVELVKEIEGLVEENFGEKYSVETDEGGKGEKRVFNLTEDTSAKLDISERAKQEISEYLERISESLSEEYNERWIEIPEEAEKESEFEEFEDDEEKEEWIEEKKIELYDDLFLDFRNDVYVYISGDYGSDVGSDFLNEIPNNYSYFGDFESSEILEQLEDGEEVLLSTFESDYSFGVELISPRLAFEEGNIDRISNLFGDISNLDFVKLHSNAGLHVHIGRLEEMMFIHYLRAAQYLRENDIEEFAERDYNLWAVEDDFLDDFENIITMNVTDQPHMATEHLEKEIDQLIRKRHRTTNFSALSKGTIEFRLGSSELAANPTALEQYLNLLKSAIDYGVSEDHMDFLGYSFWIDDKGNWKISEKDSGKEIMSSKKGGRVQMSRTYSPKTDRIWKRFVQSFNGNQKVKDIIMNGVIKIIKDDEDMKRIINPDGSFADWDAFGRYLDGYIKSGGDLNKLEKVIEYARSFGATENPISRAKILNMLGSKKSMKESILYTFLEGGMISKKIWISPQGETFGVFKNHIDFSIKITKAKNWNESKEELLDSGWVRITFEGTTPYGKHMYIEVNPDVKGRDLTKIKSSLIEIWDSIMSDASSSVYIDRSDETDYEKFENMRGRMPWDAIVRKFEDWGVNEMNKIREIVKKAFLKENTSPSFFYWISPKGKWIPLGNMTHTKYAMEKIIPQRIVRKIEDERPISPYEDRRITDFLVDKGWIKYSEISFLNDISITMKLKKGKASHKAALQVIKRANEAEGNVSIIIDNGEDREVLDVSNFRKVSQLFEEEKLEEAAKSSYYWVSPEGKGIKIPSQAYSESTHTEVAYKDLIPKMEGGQEFLDDLEDVNLGEDMRIINFMIFRGWVRVASYVRYGGEFLMTSIQCDIGAPKSKGSVTSFIKKKIEEVNAENIHVTIDNSEEVVNLTGGREWMKLGRYL